MFYKLIRENTNNIIVQLFRYTFVGAIAFLGDFSTLFVLTQYFEIYYLISAAMGFMVGLIINYFISIVWVFTKRNLDSPLLEFFIYALVGIVGLGLNEFFMWFFTEKIKIYYLLSKIGSTSFVYFFNFFVRRFTLFNKEKS